MARAIRRYGRGERRGIILVIKAMDKDSLTSKQSFERVELPHVFCIQTESFL